MDIGWSTEIDGKRMDIDWSAEMEKSLTDTDWSEEKEGIRTKDKVNCTTGTGVFATVEQMLKGLEDYAPWLMHYRLAWRGDREIKGQYTNIRHKINLEELKST
ncbi:hypothetical protein CHS0354_016475 [Potamilus streckersoni]|uniref:Uncharacterized protein n=1 Tax=Potamilus streckersoni TaxID=2493646 RepID=A0AAE0TJJ4_9BIVA|nr:hypothetical protein CHS0354_016475 [Potamilus streckersoni]